MTATDRVVLTAAEISYLIAGGAEVSALGRRAAATFGLTDSERSEAAVGAGFSSLIARGLAVSDGDHVTFAPATGAVSEAVNRSRVNVQIGLVAAEKSDGALLFDSGRARLLISPRQHRCFEVLGLDRTGDLCDQLLTIAREFFVRHRPGVVSLVVDTTGSGEVTDLSWATVAADADTWSVVFSREPSAADRGIGEIEAVARLRHRLNQLLPTGR